LFILTEQYKVPVNFYFLTAILKYSPAVKYLYLLNLFQEVIISKLGCIGNSGIPINSLKAVHPVTFLSQ